MIADEASPRTTRAGTPVRQPAKRAKAFFCLSQSVV